MGALRSNLQTHRSTYPACHACHEQSVGVVEQSACHEQSMGKAISLTPCHCERSACPERSVGKAISLPRGDCSIAMLLAMTPVVRLGAERGKPIPRRLRSTVHGPPLRFAVVPCGSSYREFVHETLTIRRFSTMMMLIRGMERDCCYLYERGGDVLPWIVSVLNKALWHPSSLRDKATARHGLSP